MKILFVLEYYSPNIGGVEVLFKNLCEGLARDGNDVTVITSRLKDTEAYEVISGVKVYRVEVPRKGSRYWFTFLSIPRVYKLAKDASLIHTTTYNGAPPAWLVSKLRGKKCIITVHEVIGSLWADLTGMTWFGARVHQFLERLILSLPFDKYVCVSRYTYDSLKQLGIKNEKLRVIYNGIDYGLFDPNIVDSARIRRSLNLENSFVYMYYGRPGISRGVEYLIQAVPSISDRIANSKLLLLLADNPRDRYQNIKETIKALNIEEKVILLNPVPRGELPDYISASNCVVIPSISEGFGFSAAEACAMGKPVVASNVGSLPDVVSGRHVLVEPRNPEAIAEGIKKIYRGETENASKKVFSWNECIKSHTEVYNKLLGRRS